VRLALRTQQVIAHETGVVNTIDPLGGSYHVEALTNRLETEAYELFGRIDELGGMVAAIEQNMPQREIADAAYRYQQEVEAEERIVVGVNKYLAGSDEQVDILRIDPDLERKQIERLQAFKARRDSAVVERRLTELSEAASLPNRNLMPVIVDAVRDGVTLGEICDAWRRAWGTWREQPVF
jgi:methylmalonyl-CoA mutase N-terminal domain/subunit